MEKIFAVRCVCGWGGRHVTFPIKRLRGLWSVSLKSSSHYVDGGPKGEWHCARPDLLFPVVTTFSAAPLPTHHFFICFFFLVRLKKTLISSHLGPFTSSKSFVPGILSNKTPLLHPIDSPSQVFLLQFTNSCHLHDPSSMR